MDRRERRRRKRAEEKLEARLTKAKSGKNIKSELHPPPAKRYFLKTILTVRVFGTVVGVGLALLGGWSVVRPVVKVDPYLQYDPSNPFSERFRVLNDGLFAIYDVEFKCDVIKATSVVGQKPFGEIDHSSILLTNSYRKVIEAADSTTIDCPLPVAYPGMAAKYNSAEIAFILSFKPEFYPWRKGRVVLFHGQLDSEENVRWVY